MILSLLGALTLLARQMNQAEDWNDTFVGQDPPQSVLIGEHRHFVGGAILLNASVTSTKKIALVAAPFVS